MKGGQATGPSRRAGRWRARALASTPRAADGPPAPAPTPRVRWTPPPSDPLPTGSHLAFGARGLDSSAGSGAAQDAAQLRTVHSSAADPVALRRLPKPALPSRDRRRAQPPGKCGVRFDPLGQFPLGQTVPPGRANPLSGSGVPLPQLHSRRPQAVAPSTPKPTGLQIPQCHSRGRHFLFRRAVRLPLPTCYSGG